MRNELTTAPAGIIRVRANGIAQTLATARAVMKFKTARSCGEWPAYKTYLAIRTAPGSEYWGDESKHYDQQNLLDRHQPDEGVYYSAHATDLLP